MSWMSGLRVKTLGDDRRFVQGTGLLYIAGEKIEYSGTLGQSYIFNLSVGQTAPLLFTGEFT